MRVRISCEGQDPDAAARGILSIYPNGRGTALRTLTVWVRIPRLRQRLGEGIQRSRPQPGHTRVRTPQSLPGPVVQRMNDGLLPRAHAGPNPARFTALRSNHAWH